MVIGKGYDVADFTNELANGNVIVKCQHVALVVGNEQDMVGTNVNMARQIERLIRQVWIVKPTAQVFVSSVMPRPTKETVTQSVVMKTNEGVAKMCRRLNKYGQSSVRYMPLHQNFLEKWKHMDMKSGKMLITTRVKQPHGLYFGLGTDFLNQTGAQLFLDRLEESVKFHLERPAKSLEQQQGLVVQIENEWATPMQKADHLGDDSQKSEKVQSGSAGREVTEGEFGVNHKENRGLAGRQLKKAEKPTVQTCGRPCDTPVVKKRKKEQAEIKNPNKVSQMVDKWEQLSQGRPPLDDLDLELGEESVVRVDLGDQPRGADSSRKMMK